MQRLGVEERLDAEKPSIELFGTRKRRRRPRSHSRRVMWAPVRGRSSTHVSRGRPDAHRSGPRALLQPATRPERRCSVVGCAGAAECEQVRRSPRPVRRHVLDGLGREPLPGRRREPLPAGPRRRLRDRRTHGEQRRLRPFHRRHRVHHDRRAGGVVVRLRRAPAGQFPPDPRGGASPLVAPGLRRNVAAPRRPGVRPRRKVRPPGGARVLDGCAGILPLGRRPVAVRRSSGSSRHVAVSSSAGTPGATS